MQTDDEEKKENTLNAVTGRYCFAQLIGDHPTGCLDPLR